MTDHAQRARAHRERLRAAIENMEKTEVCLDIFDRAIDQAAQEAVQVFQETIRDYVTMRADMAEQGIATEVLSGNTVKEARERSALTELHGLQDAVLNYWKLPRKAAQPVWSGERPRATGSWLYRKGKKGAIDICTIRQVDLDLWDQIPHPPDTEWAPCVLPREA